MSNENPPQIKNLSRAEIQAELEAAKARNAERDRKEEETKKTIQDAKDAVAAATAKRQASTSGGSAAPAAPSNTQGAPAAESKWKKAKQKIADAAKGGTKMGSDLISRSREVKLPSLSVKAIQKAPTDNIVRMNLKNRGENEKRIPKLAKTPDEQPKGKTEKTPGPQTAEEMQNATARAGYLELKKHKPEAGSSLYVEMQARLETYKSTKKKVVETLLAKGERAEAQKFLLQEVELSRKNDIENGSVIGKTLQSLKKGLTWFENIGTDTNDSKAVRFAKKAGKTFVNVALIGGASAAVVAGAAAVGIGSAAAISGGIITYAGKRALSSVVVGNAIQGLPPKLRAVAAPAMMGLSYIMSPVGGAVLVAGAAGLGASKLAGLATKKWLSDKAIGEAVNKKIEDQGIDLDKLDELEEEYQKITAQAEKKRWGRKILLGATALAAGVLSLEVMGHAYDKAHADTEMKHNAEIKQRTEAAHRADVKAVDQAMTKHDNDVKIIMDSQKRYLDAVKSNSGPKAIEALRSEYHNNLQQHQANLKVDEDILKEHHGDTGKLAAIKNEEATVSGELERTNSDANSVSQPAHEPTPGPATPTPAPEPAHQPTTPVPAPDSGHASPHHHAAPAPHHHNTPQHHDIRPPAPHIPPAEGTTYTGFKGDAIHGDKGAGEALLEFKAHMREQYHHDFFHAPKNVQEFMKERNINEQTAELGLYDGQHSVIVHDGANFEFDSHGNLIFHNGSAGEHTLLHGETGTATVPPATETLPHSSDFLSKMGVDKLRPGEVIRETQITHESGVAHPHTDAEKLSEALKAQMALAEKRGSPTKHEAANGAQNHATTTEEKTSQSSQATIDTNGKIHFPGLAPEKAVEVDHILRDHPEFADNYFFNHLHVKGEELLEAYNASKRDLDFVFRNQSTTWHETSHLNVNAVLYDTKLIQSSPGITHLSNYLHELRNASGLLPKTGILGIIGGEDTKHYVASALEKLAHEGKLQEFEAHIEDKIRK